MNGLRLVDEKDPILRSVAAPWDWDNPICDPQLLVSQMYDIMRMNRGIGLAAPQVGISTQLFIMHIDKNKACFNPKILQIQDTKINEIEGCLSFPNLYIKVLRPLAITVEYQDSFGLTVKEDLSGLEARCFQHELDHLNGITFDTRVSKLVLSMARKKQKKGTR